jgi:hypothetical protein
MKGDLYGKDEAKAAILQPQLDARTVQVSVDPDKGTITSALAAADVPLGPQRTETIEDYADRMFATTFRSATRRPRSTSVARSASPSPAPATGPTRPARSGAARRSSRSSTCSRT